MASFVERLAYIISANAENAKREFRSAHDTAKRELGGTESVLNKFNAGTAGLGAGLKGFGAGLVASIGASGALTAFNELTTAASDLEQSLGAIETVFGDAGSVIEEFGETAADTAGLSKREVNQMAAVIGAQLQGMGFSATEAADQVVVLQKRAADMAATFGGPTSQALTAISALFRGERDPIEKYGVTMKETDVKARAAALGLDTSTIASRRYANAVASLDLVLGGTAKTQGQFNREMDTAANAASRAAAAYENAKAEFGTSLLPFKTQLTEVSITAVRAGDDIARLGAEVVKSNTTVRAARGAVDLFKSLVGASDEAASAADANSDAQTAQAAAILAAGEAAAVAEVAFDTYKQAIEELADEAFDVTAAQDDVAQSLLDLERQTEVSAKRKADAEDRYADAVERANDRIRDAEKAVGEAREDAGKVNVPGQQRDAAEERLRDAEERLAEVREEAEENVAAAREVKDEIDEWTPSLDRATAAGLKNRDTVQQIVEKALKVATTMREEGALAEEINAYLQTQITRISEVATQVGFSRDAMREYLDLLGKAQGLLSGTGPRVLDSFGDVVSGAPLTPPSRGPLATIGMSPDVLRQTLPQVVINTGYVENPQKLAEIVGAEISRQLRRRG